MKTNKLIMAIVLAGAMMYCACGSGDQKETTSGAVEAEITTDTIHPYICPMRCENSASFEAGTCKVCGMDLVSNSDYKGETELENIEEKPNSETALPDTGHSHDGHTH